MVSFNNNSNRKQNWKGNTRGILTELVIREHLLLREPMITKSMILKSFVVKLIFFIAKSHVFEKENPLFDKL